MILLPKPVIAIGGINISNIDPLLQIGANHIAVSSAILASNQPKLTTKKLAQHLRKL